MKPIVRADRKDPGLGGARLLAAVLATVTLACALSALALDANRDYFVSFKSRTYTDPEQGFICLPRECLSYIKFHSAAKKRPLIATGWGKEGVLKLGTSPNDQMILITSSGTGVLEFTEFAAVPSVDSADFACAEWVRQQPDLTVRINRIVQWEEQGNTMTKFCDLIAMPGRNSPPPPNPRFKALADLEIRSGAKSVSIGNVPIAVEFTMHVEQVWGFVRTYWLMTVTASGSFRGDALGLTGADAGEIGFDLVTAGLRPMPPPSKAGDDASFDADGTRIESLGVSHE